MFRFDTDVILNLQHLHFGGSSQDFRQMTVVMRLEMLHKYERHSCVRRQR
jgi:hypothetical protein